jgi:CcmD family protein
MDQRNFLYMFYGFAAVWVLLAIYVATLVGREKAIRSQLDTLKRTLSEEKLNP